MSGGTFDYVQSRIPEISENIQEELDNQGKIYDEDPPFGDGKHPSYSEDVQKIFKDGIDVLKKAYIYAQRIDWFLAGDDGEDNLKLRLKEELIKAGFLEEEKVDPWAWVKSEYCAMFKAKNPKKGGKIRESVARMKKMFAAMPEIRKEDVIATTKLYLSQTDSRFIRFPHYFLKKGQGADAIYEFADWYDKYKEAQEAGAGRTSTINTMQ